MIRTPEGRDRAAVLAGDYVAGMVHGLGPEQAQLVAPGDNVDTEMARLANRAAETVTELELQLEANQTTAAALFGNFIPALLGARAAAHDIALTQGQFMPTDEASLAQAGTGLADIKNYLVPFALAKDVSLPEDMPQLSISTMLRMRGAGINGHDAYVDVSAGRLSLLDYNTEWPRYNHDFAVPVLFDPQTYTMAEFSALAAESADGYAGQVTDTWNTIRESERDHPSFTGEPLVVRAVSVLPAAAENDTYSIDFLPAIGKSAADRRQPQIRRAYDTRLLVKGNANAGANYIKLDFGDALQPVFADANGKRAPLTINPGEAVTDQPQAFEDLGKTSRSQGALAFYMAPQVIKEKPSVVPELSTGFSPHMFDGGATKSGGPRGVGSASVGVGPGSSWMSSERRSEGFIDRVAPELIGRPIIVSMQLLTFEQ